MSKKPTTAIEFHYDGKDYQISPGDLTAVEARDYRRTMGESLARTMTGGDIDIDVIATLVWLVDRRTNPGISWESIADRMTYDAMTDVEIDEGEPDPSG